MEKIRSYFSSLSKLPKNSSGQSTVEYILLLFIVASIVYTVTNNRLFQSTFSEDSEFFTAIKRYMEYTYQHASNDIAPQSALVNYNYSNEGLVHELYYNPRPKEGGESTRFFGPLEKYPVQ